MAYAGQSWILNSWDIDGDGINEWDADKFFQFKNVLSFIKEQVNSPNKEIMHSID